MYVCMYMYMHMHLLYKQYKGREHCISKLPIFTVTELQSENQSIKQDFQSTYVFL